MKKTLAIILALVLVMSLTVPVFAAEGPASGTFNDTTGTITITKYNPSNTYSIYRMLDLQSFNTAGEGSYAYVVNSAWTAFFNEEAGGEGAAYVTIENGYVSWKKNVVETKAAEFAEKALKFAKDNSISPLATSSGEGVKVEGTDTYTFKDLALGYYLVDSTMGALCGLTTTNPDASINAKNGEPTLTLNVQENSTSLWGLTNSANIGDTVAFRATISVAAGAENYILHIELDDDLINPEHVKITYGDQDVSADNYTVKKENITDDCDIAIVFDEDYCRTLEAGKNLYVYFDATLNETATENPGVGHESSAVLQFGEIFEDSGKNHLTQEQVVTTYTYAFDLVKTDKQNSLLDGAYFLVLRMDEGVLKEIPLALEGDIDGEHYFRPAMSESEIYKHEPVTAEDDENSVLVAGGKLRFVGFDSGDYYFRETVAPDGYNKLQTEVKFTLGSVNKDALFNSGVYSSGSGFHITNQSGAMLPETGAMGTVLFITFGTLAVLATGVLLVTKKRMSMIQE